MIRLPGELRKRGLHAQILLQVHDELMLECPEAELAQTRNAVQEVMENITTLTVPLLTEAKSGTNWGNLSAAD